MPLNDLFSALTVRYMTRRFIGEYCPTLGKLLYIWTFFCTSKKAQQYRIWSTTFAVSYWPNRELCTSIISLSIKTEFIMEFVNTCNIKLARCKEKRITKWLESDDVSVFNFHRFLSLISHSVVSVTPTFIVFGYFCIITSEVWTFNESPIDQRNASLKDTNTITAT